MERVMRELDAMMSESDANRDPIEEQLRQCPEAFQAGELVGKMFDRLKYGREELGNEHFFPPAGALVPPLV